MAIGNVSISFSDTYYKIQESHLGPIKKVPFGEKGVMIDGFNLDVSSLMKYLNKKFPNQRLSKKNFYILKISSPTTEEVKDLFYKYIESRLS